MCSLFSVSKATVVVVAAADASVEIAAGAAAGSVVEAALWADTAVAEVAA